MVSRQRVVRRATTTANPTRRLLAQHLLTDAPMLGTEPTLIRRAAHSLPLATADSTVATPVVRVAAAWAEVSQRHSRSWVCCCWLE